MAGQGESARAHKYELGHSDRELKRLRLQAKLIDPFTRQFYRDAGLEQGMRVLDVGSGGGDAALLAAELVGDRGEVVGVDTAPAAVSAAQARIKALERRNISFRHGDLDRLEFSETFDAAVGRYVLMFNRDPAAMLKSVARFVRPGSVKRSPFKPRGPQIRTVPRLDCSDVQEGRHQSLYGSGSAFGLCASGHPRAIDGPASAHREPHRRHRLCRPDRRSWRSQWRQ